MKSRRAVSQIPGDVTELVKGERYPQEYMGPGNVEYGSLTPKEEDIMITGGTLDSPAGEYVKTPAQETLDMLTKKTVKANRKRQSRPCIACELIRIAEDLQDIEPKIAGTLMQEAKALKMKGVVTKFFDNVKKFRGNMNAFVEEITGLVRDPKALAAFPEFRDVLELGTVMKKGVLRDAMMPEEEIVKKLYKVAEMDTPLTV